MPLRILFPVAEAARIADGVRRGELPAGLDGRAPDRRVAYALDRLARPAARVREVAADLGLSERHLRRLMLDRTGLEPRTLRGIARFQRFLAMADAGEPSLAVLAASAGYADQAHLSREVRALSGLTPTALLAERGRARP